MEAEIEKERKGEMRKRGTRESRGEEIGGGGGRREVKENLQIYDS